MILKPLLEFGILLAQRQCFGYLAIVGIVSPGSVGQQDLFGFESGHSCVLSLRCDTSLASSFCNCPIPREILDFTVPSGSPRMSAICL